MNNNNNLLNNNNLSVQTDLTIINVNDLEINDLRRLIDNSFDSDIDTDVNSVIIIIKEYEYQDIFDLISLIFE